MKRYNSFGSDIESDDDISGYEKQERRPRKERQLSWQGHSLTPKVQKIQEPRRSLRGLKRQHAFRRLDSLSSLPKPAGPKRGVTHPTLDRQDSMDSVAENRSTTIPYFDKLCWACDEVGYPRAYANLVAFQFLGLNSSRPITHINGHIPLVAELVEFVAEAFMRITDFADLILVFIDDFQWVDSFTWKVIRALGQSGKKMLLICAMRSHDKQAMRRMSTAVNFRLEITLGPLDLPEIEELISSAFGCTESSINDDICTDMYQRTGGLPVYVIELLEAIKRNKAFSQGEDGKLKIKYDEKSVDVSFFVGITGKGFFSLSICFLILFSQHEQKGKGYTAFLESLLYRFDALDVRVRKVLQTCAVLGKSFSLSDLIRVHPDINEVEIEHALEIATEEMILVEITEDDDDTRSILSHSTGGSESRRGSSIEYSKTSSGFVATGDRCFEFSHDMWRTNILTTMLKERKIELHRLIAEAMEHNQDQILQRSDIARLLTLFDHWKSCGDFRKAAPLAVAVGARLNEWELVAQSLDLYQDALDMCFDSVEAVDNRRSRSDGKLVAIFWCLLLWNFSDYIGNLLR